MRLMKMFQMFHKNFSVILKDIIFEKNYEIEKNVRPEVHAKLCLETKNALMRR